ncbi:MAG: thioredoxin family protein [Burkholderiaceae bacterium]
MTRRPSPIRLLSLALASLLTIGTVHAQSLKQAVVDTGQVRAELLAHAPEGVQPGGTVWLGLRLQHTPDWHTYWKNPGDSGLPTEFQWTLPEGVTTGEVAWPTPRKFPLGPLANYGYNGTVVLPVSVQIPADFTASSLDVSLTAAWLACKTECIPEEGQFRIRLPAQGSTAMHGADFSAAFDAAPRQDTTARGQVSPQAASQQLAVELEGLPAGWNDARLEFFPETPGLIDPGAPWTQTWADGHWQASIPLSPYRSDAPASLALVVALADSPGEGPGQAGVRVEVPVSGAWPPVAALPSAVPDALSAALQANAARTDASAPATSGGTATVTLWAALLGALLGGVILNLMPCVFPVLAIKVLAFTRPGEASHAHRSQGLAYTAGVVLSFLALGGLLLGLRAAGEAIGWGFQLQSPAVVAALALLFTLIGLNLAGLFEFGSVLPSGVASLQARHPTADAFLTGVLATAVASPCTAPFMGASLGLAVGLPALQALSVFGLLGLGMALPYLAASWWPGVARLLPRPGAWMVHFRQFMAFPMFATVVWLLWVLGQQSGIDGVAALLLLLLLLTLLIWSLGLSGRARLLVGGLSAAALVWVGASVGPNVTRLQDGSAPASQATAVDGATWQAWSPERLASLQEQGRPVFVDFTAAWCVTCQFNKRTTLSDRDVLQDMADRQVALLRADWTRRDPAVTAALAELGRNGVPVYAIYRKGKAPVVLTEVLTVGEVREALRGL